MHSHLSILIPGWVSRSRHLQSAWWKPSKPDHKIEHVIFLHQYIPYPDHKARQRFNGALHAIIDEFLADSLQLLVNFSSGVETDLNHSRHASLCQVNQGIGVEY